MNKEYFLEKIFVKRLNYNQNYSYDLVPDFFTAHDKIDVICKYHGKFSQKAYSHLNGQGCPECGRIKSEFSRLRSKEFVIKRFKNTFGDDYTYEKFTYRGMELPAIITCRKHGDLLVVPKIFISNGDGCPFCRREKNTKQMIEKAKKVHNDFYNYSKVNLQSFALDKVEIICPFHGSFWQTMFDHSNKKHGCWNCGREATRNTTTSFIEKARKIHKETYCYNKTKYITDNDKVVITCFKHGDFYQRPSSHLNGNGCKKCFLETNKSSAEEFIEKARKIHGDKYYYNNVKYYGNKKKVEIICPIHGSFWQRPDSHISKKTGCWNCSESKGENAVEYVLKKHNVNHIREYRIKPYRYRYDFYLPDHNIFIEFNGLQHYRSIDFFGGTKAFKETKSRDLKKKQLVKEIGGKLITLTYQDLIDNSVEKRLLMKLKNKGVVIPD